MAARASSMLTMVSSPGPVYEGWDGEDAREPQLV